MISSTKCNIIVHNLGENKHERINDKDNVEEVVKGKIGFNVNIVKVERIGARENDIYKTKRWRSLKVTLTNEEDKE